MHIKNIILLICCLALLSACQQTPLKKAMERAGDNAPELQKVLDHYSKNQADSLKYKAAVFLIENMLYHFGFEQVIYQNNKEVESFSWENPNMNQKITSERSKDIRNSIINETIDSLGYFIQKGDALWDLEHITSELLIENIDYAFKAWEMPWSRHLSFDEFCDYILPYRCQTEPLSQWRKYFFDKYSWIKDSLPKDCTPLDACIYLKEQVKHDLIYSNSHRPFYQGFLSPLVYDKVQVGSCEPLASQASLIMRSVGIPVVYDAVLYWKNNDVGHVFNWVVTNDKVGGYFFGILDKYNPERYNKSLGTVMRRTYRHYENPLWERFIKGESVTPGLLSTYQKDVTALYCSTDSLVIELEGTLPSEQPYYLCQLTKRGLKALRYTFIEDENKLSFPHVTESFMYILASYQLGHLSTVGEPFVFTGDSVKKVKTNREVLSDYTLKWEDVKKINHNHRNPDFFLGYWQDGTWTPIETKVILHENNREGSNDEQKKEDVYDLVLKNIPERALVMLHHPQWWAYKPFTFDKDGNLQIL